MMFKAAHANSSSRRKFCGKLSLRIHYLHVTSTYRASDYFLIFLLRNVKSVVRNTCCSRFIGGKKVLQNRHRHGVNAKPCIEIRASFCPSFSDPRRCGGSGELGSAHREPGWRSQLGHRDRYRARSSHPLGRGPDLDRRPR